MGFRFLPILAFLTVALVASHAALAPELYWKSVLPNTPMPKAVRDLLHPDLLEEKGTSVDVGKGGVNVDAGKGKPGGTSVGVGKGGVNVDSGKGKPGGTSVNVGKGGVNVNTGNGTQGGGTHVSVGGKGKGVGVNTGKPGGKTNVGVGKGGVSVNTGGKGKPVHVGVKPGPDPFVYNYAASEDQLHDDPNVALFFLEKDMKVGTQMNLHFTESSNTATLLPRQVSKSIPFSSEKLPEIMNRFSVKPGSVEAEIMQNTIKNCEEPSIKGEEKYCATSLESMIDFSTSKLGKGVQAFSTEVEKRTRLQKDTIAAGVKKMPSAFWISISMSPLLILASVPTSNTGVFPDKFLSSRGPNCGRSNPNRAVSPSINHDTMSRNLSTRRMGSHLSNHMDNPKVDFPSISRGRTCTFSFTKKKIN